MYAKGFGLGLSKPRPVGTWIHSKFCFLHGPGMWKEATDALGRGVV